MVLGFIRLDYIPSPLLSLLCPLWRDRTKIVNEYREGTSDASTLSSLVIVVVVVKAACRFSTIKISVFIV